MKVIKKIKTLCICTALLCAMGMTASAASSYPYSYYIPGPNRPISRYTTSYTASNDPFVKPNVIATPTNYYLAFPDKEGYNVSNLVRDVSDTVRRDFTYLSGYGGSGEKYRLGAFPSSSDYYTYRVSGSWSP